MSALLSTRNARAIDRATVPRLPFDALRGAVVDAVRRDERIVAYFGAPHGDAVELFVVVASDHEGLLRVGSTLVVGGSFPSLTSEVTQVHLFEREIAEQWGLLPEGHPWLKPVRFAPSNRPDRDVWKRTGPARVGEMDFYRVEGEEIHEVAVGPVHAGVIEPGHFRFQCHGEHVFHLEISLGYQHRGVERSLRGGPNKRTVHTMETLAGDSTVAHTTAYCQLVEAMTGARVPARAQVIRGIALELERLANHTGNLGALANDVGFLPTASYCGRLRGDFLNLSAAICGSRFGRGLVRPGGVAFDLDDDRRTTMLERLASAARDVERSIALLWNSPSVQARFEETGVVAPTVASQLGLVGVAARACGLERDVRQDLPTGIYRMTKIPVSVWHSGDVFARAWVRALEVQRSAAFVREQLNMLPKGETRATTVPSLPPGRFCVSLVEGWRGEVCHVATTDEQGRFAAYKVVDASFHNWIGLAMALRDQQISDFPLCNKSFDLSYCGFDL